MTERTIKHYAIELAGQFYDMVRTAESQGEKVNISRGARAVLTIDPKAFGKTFPTVKDYIHGKRHGRIERLPDGTVRHIDDGSMRLDTPGWLHWYEMARKQLTAMLGMPNVHQNIKDGIYAALLEDREKEYRQGTSRSPTIPQRKRLDGN